MANENKRTALLIEDYDKSWPVVRGHRFDHESSVKIHEGATLGVCSCGSVMVLPVNHPKWFFVGVPDCQEIK